MSAPSVAADPDRRRATVMFVDLVGATQLSAEVGIEPAYAIVTGCLRVLDGIARRHGGVVDRYLSDCLMAVFGFPIASANAPAAAVAAALEMQGAAARFAADAGSPLPLVLRIGVNTGPMIAGDLRGAVVREFAVMGDAVNVAARLKDVGEPGCIHLGGETADALGGRFALEALPPLVLRGKRQQVAAYRVAPAVAPRRAGSGDDAALVDTPLIGREHVTSALGAALAAAAAGGARVVVLSGDEGLGKSRLARELCREAEARGGSGIVAGAAPAGEAAALSVLEDLRAALAPADGAGPADLAAALAARAARGPAVVVCEDLQWADAPSFDALGRLVRATADRPLLWLFTLRPGTPAEARLRAALGDGVAVIALAPLAPDAARRLLAHVAGDRELSPAAADRIEARAGGNPFRLILGALLAGAVETELAQEAASGERGADAERRRVTVLFADITGFTRMSEQLPPAEAYRAVTGCLQVLHEVAVKHGGSVDKYLGDCILATFGVPIALEDAARAAVNAAIEMQRRVREYNETARLPSPLDIHVGINSGLSVAGDVSGPLLREFTLMGEAVSVASKLKDVAPAGRVWVGPETHRATRDDFRYEPAPASAAERASAGEAWELRSEREQLYRRRVGRGETIFTELVGRDDELAMLRATVGRLANGEGGVAGVVGDAGLGKSRLLAELADSPEGRAVRWAEGRSIAMGRTLRFHPIVDLLRSLLGRDGAAPETYDALVEALRPVLGAETREIAPYLAMILGMALPAEVAAEVAGVQVEVIDRLYLRAVRDLFRHLADRGPLVLFFEDLYWADRASIDLLATLVALAGDHPILFLYAARPGYPETTGRIADAAATSLPAERVLHVELRPLDAAGTSKLLGTLFRHGALPRSSRERIAERAGGNPLYVEELLRSLIEQGAVEATDDGLRATARIESMVVPATVQEVILARVDHLRPRPKQALQIAAVVGQRVSEPVLGDLVSEPETLGADLAQLVEAQLLVAEDRGEVRCFTFKHRLIQDVTYDSILEMRRAELHRDVGRVIERRMPGAPGFHGMLAYHYSMGNDLVRAEEELFLAGDDAARAGAPVEALELLQESSRLYLARHPGGGDPRKRVALHKRLAVAYLHRGQMEDSTRSFNEALALLGEVNPTTRAGIGLELLQTFTLVGLDLYFRGGGAARRPPATPLDLEVIQLMFDRARTQTTADPVRFILQGMATLRRLRRVDPATVPGASMVYAGMVGTFGFGGISFDISRRFLGVAERYAATPVDTFFWRVMTFTHHFLAGDWDDRHEIPLPAVEDAVRRGQLWDVGHYVGCDAIKRAAQGRWRETDEQIDWLERLKEQYAYDLAAVYCHACPAYLHTERRVLDAALAECDAYFHAYDEVLLNLLALGTKAQVQILLDDLAGARATLDVAAGRMPTGAVPPWHFGAVARSRLLLAVREAEDGATRRRPALGRSRRVRRDALWAAARFAWFRPEIWQAVGDLHWLAGRRRRALRWYGRALDEAERLAMRPNAARVRLAIARRLLEAGGSAARFRDRDAAALCAEARHAFETLDLGWDLARLEDLAAATRGPVLAAALA